MRAWACLVCAVAAACGGTVDATNGAGGGNGGAGGAVDGGVAAANACARGATTFLVPSAAQDARSVATDGARVYFTTWGVDDTQRGGMILSAPTSGGAPTVIASGEGTTTDIAVDAANVYWMNYGDALRVAPKHGGAARTLMATDQPMSFAIDDAFAYVTTTGGIWRVAIAGGAPEKIADARASEAIAVDADWVYWTDRGAVGADATALSRVPKRGGAVEVLASGPGVFAKTYTQSLVVDATSVYWVATRADGVVARVPKTGGEPTTLVAGLVCPYTLRASGDGLVYANGVIACGPATLPARSFASVPPSGGATQPIVNAESVGVQGAFAVDAHNVYWAGGGASGRGIYCTAIP